VSSYSESTTYYMQGYRKYIVGKILRLIQQSDNFIFDISEINSSYLSISNTEIILKLSYKKRDK